MAASWREIEEPRRIAALRRIMDARGLDAIVIVGGANLTYYSGFAGVERSMARPMFYICPRQGEPAIVAHTFRQHLVEAHSWVGRFHYFTRLSEAPLPAVSDALHEMGLSEGRLGFELGYESQIHMPFADFENLRVHLKAFEIVDVARELWRVRMERSPGELDRQRAAASIVCKLFADGFAHIRKGMRQADLQRFLAERALAYGSGPSFAIISAGAGNYEYCGAWAPDYSFKDGDMIWMDIGASSGGYSMLFSRAGVIGTPTAEQKTTARAVHTATMAGISAIRPGATPAHIARVCRRELDAIDAPVITDIAELSTRHGHGIGIEFIEPPHVAEYDDTELVPGMVLAVEPGISTAFGRFHFREVAVVTPAGFEMIEGPPAELAEIGTS
jgi:Xaa-Pro dipeptidase